MCDTPCRCDYQGQYLQSHEKQISSDELRSCFFFVRVFVLTIFGFAGAIVWLQQVALHTAAGVGALCVCARLAACPVHIALVEIYMVITQPITNILPQHIASDALGHNIFQRNVT